MADGTPITVANALLNQCRMQTLLVLAVLIVGCTASGNQFFHFELGQQLMCMNRNPHAVPGEPPFVLENIPLISFVPGEPGSVYLPMTSG